MALLARAKVSHRFTSTAKHFAEEQTGRKQRTASTNMLTDTSVTKHIAGTGRRRLSLSGH